MNELAVQYWSARRLDRSIPLLEEELKRREAKSGRGDKDARMAVTNLGVNYKHARRLGEAIPLLEEAFGGATDSLALRAAGGPLLDAHATAGDAPAAARVAAGLVADARRRLPADAPGLAQELSAFGLTLLRAKAFAEAEPLLRESLAVRETVRPDGWGTFDTRSALGGALLGQQRYKDAEPLLLAGYTGMKQRQSSIPPPARARLTEALDRLIDLYTATDQPDEAQKWRTERATYPAATTQPAR